MVVSVNWIFWMAWIFWMLYKNRYGIVFYRRLTMIFPVTVLPSSKVTFTK